VSGVECKSTWIDSSHRNTTVFSLSVHLSEPAERATTVREDASSAAWLCRFLQYILGGKPNQRELADKNVKNRRDSSVSPSVHLKGSAGSEGETGPQVHV